MKTELEDGYDQIYAKVREAFSKMKLRPFHEQKRIEKEQEEYKQKYGLKAFQKKLRKEFGLD